MTMNDCPRQLGRDSDRINGDTADDDDDDDDVPKRGPKSGPKTSTRWGPGGLQEGPKRALGVAQRDPKKAPKAPPFRKREYCWVVRPAPFRKITYVSVTCPSCGRFGLF